MDVRFPDADVELSGEDGNAFAIIGRTQRALRKAGATPEELKQYCEEAMSSDYDNVLATTMRWVNVS